MFTLNSNPILNNEMRGRDGEMSCRWRWVEKWERLMTTIKIYAVMYSFVHSNTHTLYCAMDSISMCDDYAVGVLFSLFCCCYFDVYGIMPLYSLCLVSVLVGNWSCSFVPSGYSLCSFVECTVIWTQFSIVCADWLSITILLYRPIENVESVSIEIDGLERTASFLEFPGEVRCCVTMVLEFMWYSIVWNDAVWELIVLVLEKGFCYVWG